MKDKCRICGDIVQDFRTSHLKQHGIDADYKGAVREYFMESVENAS